MRVYLKTLKNPITITEIFISKNRKKNIFIVRHKISQLQKMYLK